MSQTQPSEKFEEFPPSFEEMDEHLGDARRDILTLLYEADSSGLNTKELRVQAGIKRGSIRHHTGKLERWELLEETDRVYTGRGSRAIVWQLTERGEAFYENGMDSAPPALVRPAEVDALREELIEMQRQHERDIEELKSRMQESIEMLEQEVKKQTTQ